MLMHYNTAAYFGFTASVYADLCPSSATSRTFQRAGWQLGLKHFSSSGTSHTRAASSSSPRMQRTLAAPQ
eukprot:1122960-Pyramimonas_sp.AAC.2